MTPDRIALRNFIARCAHGVAWGNEEKRKQRQYIANAFDELIKYFTYSMTEDESQAIRGYWYIKSAIEEPATLVEHEEQTW